VPFLIATFENGRVSHGAWRTLAVQRVRSLRETSAKSSRKQRRRRPLERRTMKNKR
jgi:hypothetical protein